MADDKKKKPEAPAPGNPLNEIIFLLAGLLILGVIATRFMIYLESIGWGSWETSWTRILDLLFRPFWPAWKVVAVVLSAGFLILGIYAWKKLTEIEEEEKKIFGAMPEDTLLAEVVPAAKEKGNEKWLRVMEHANSNNPSDWRLAIIEADVMLEELLRLSGYQGDSVGEMLKSIESGDIQNLEAAWEAHKVRNRIAHSGGDFQLNERETMRTIALFESVFREFDII